uniref:RING-type domain-containing protein n=1 Tax=viral metagenome TaxID=1070528 RepID=A0A6C0C1J1_9ZZZZ
MPTQRERRERKKFIENKEGKQQKQKPTNSIQVHPCSNDEEHLYFISADANLQIEEIPKKMESADNFAMDLYEQSIAELDLEIDQVGSYLNEVTIPNTTTWLMNQCELRKSFEAFSENTQQNPVLRTWKGFKYKKFMYHAYPQHFGEYLRNEFNNEAQFRLNGAEIMRNALMQLTYVERNLFEYVQNEFAGHGVALQRTAYIHNTTRGDVIAHVKGYRTEINITSGRESVVRRIHKIKDTNKRDQACAICYRSSSARTLCSVCDGEYCLNCYAELFKKGGGVITCPFCRHAIGQNLRDTNFLQFQTAYHFLKERAIVAFPV